MTTIAVLIARGGSKRLPGKNIMDFCGHPLIAWTIIHARACKKIDEVYVSTDSEEIAEISRNYGATVLMREDPRESIDSAPGTVPMNIAFKRIAQMRSVDTVIHLFCTSPLRKPGDIDRLIQAYEETGKPHSFYTVIKDAFIYKKIDDHICREVIRNKTGFYLYGVGGTGISSIEPIPIVDWNDKATWQDPGPLNPNPFYYVLVDWWQEFEVDRQSDFDICEFFFERYLLTEWEAIYERLSEGM